MDKMDEKGGSSKSEAASFQREQDKLRKTPLRILAFTKDENLIQYLEEYCLATNSVLFCYQEDDAGEIGNFLANDIVNVVIANMDDDRKEDVIQLMKLAFKTQRKSLLLTVIVTVGMNENYAGLTLTVPPDLEMLGLCLSDCYFLRQLEIKSHFSVEKVLDKLEERKQVIAIDECNVKSADVDGDKSVRKKKQKDMRGKDNRYRSFRVIGGNGNR